MTGKSSNLKILNHPFYSTYMPIADIFAVAKNIQLYALPDAPPLATQYGELESPHSIDVHLHKMLATDYVERNGHRYVELRLKGAAEGFEINVDDIRIDEKCKMSIFHAPVAVVWINRNKEQELRDYIYDASGIPRSLKTISKDLHRRHQNSRSSLEILRQEFDADTSHPYQPRSLEVLLKECGRKQPAISSIHKRFLDGVISAINNGASTLKYDGKDYARSDFKIEGTKLRMENGKLWIKGEAGESLARKLATGRAITFTTVSGGAHGLKR